MYQYDTNIGRIFIKYINGKYYFEFKNNIYDGHISAQVVADNVYAFVTGCHEWDFYEEMTDYEDVPTDLSEWKRC